MLKRILFIVLLFLAFGTAGTWDYVDRQAKVQQLIDNVSKEKTYSFSCAPLVEPIHYKSTVQWNSTEKELMCDMMRSNKL